MKFSEQSLLLSYRFKTTEPVLVDVGAHHGGFSRGFAGQGWKVIAFEPERKNYAAFMQALCGIDRVTCISKAVSDVSGRTVPFYVSEEHYGIHSLQPFHETHKFAYEVETTTLDDALKELGVQSVTLLKVDTEGADFLALKGFDVRRYHPELVMVEFMDERTLPHFGYSHHDMAGYMKERGYETFVSEWEPITQYAREGEPSPPHVWMGCASYPLGHAPAWGNLFFVPAHETGKFRRALSGYLKKQRRSEVADRLWGWTRRVPGAQWLRRALRGLRPYYGRFLL
jgi:FkbM family methyltransferase